MWAAYKLEVVIYPAMAAEFLFCFVFRAWSFPSLGSFIPKLWSFCVYLLGCKAVLGDIQRHIIHVTHVLYSSPLHPINL